MIEIEISEIRRLNPEFTERIAQGVDALRSGKRTAACRLFAQTVCEEPNNATAWLWLSRSVRDEDQRRECLERVEQLDEARAVASNTLVSQNAPVRRSAQAASVLERRPLLCRRWAQLAALTLILAPLIWVFASRTVALPARAQTDRGNIETSGIIRAEEVLIASEYGGRIDTIPVREGQAVTANQVLVRLDTALLDAQIEAAKAAIALAEARSAQARAGARAGQITVAEAQLAQAQAARIAAAQTAHDTRALVENPQEIRMQIAVLQAQIEAEEHRLAQRLALKDAAEVAKDNFEEAQEKIVELGGPGRRSVRVDNPYVPGGRTTVKVDVPSLPLEAHLTPNVWWQAWVDVNATAAQKEGLEASLAHLYTQRQNPQELKARSDEAIATLAQAEAQVVAAQAQVDGLKAGATQERIAALEARVAQARASLDSRLSQRAMMEIRSPMDGVVVSLSAHEGEVVAPGATIVTVADLTRVRLTVYLPETQVGRVSVGHAVQVTVDSFPDRVFEGTITHIADSAEFTPRNVATQEERVNLVFAVEISLDNEDGALKPGMPADAAITDSK